VDALRGVTWRRHGVMVVEAMRARRLAAVQAIVRAAPAAIVPTRNAIQACWQPRACLEVVREKAHDSVRADRLRAVDDAAAQREAHGRDRNESEPNKTQLHDHPPAACTAW